ncbi:MAG: DUF3450 family protein [Myxococcota bacterium]|nr:DUF3450 family protein [Myxococcota bacterium]
MPDSPHSLRRKRWLRLGSLAVALFVMSPTGASSEGEVDGFRTKLEKWVETRRIISEERTGWQADKETLRDTRRLLTQQKKELSEKIATAEQATTESEDARRDLLLERGEFQRANRTLEAQIAELEQGTLALVARLPAPLTAKIEPLVAQIPEDPEGAETPLGQRLVNVLGVLSQAEQFNANAHLVGETRAVVEGDQRVAIRTLYWGLGQAVYAAAQGRAAGIARPGPDGWVFENDSSLTADAELLLDIYEGNTDAIEFIELPVQLGAAAQ